LKSKKSSKIKAAGLNDSEVLGDQRIYPARLHGFLLPHSELCRRQFLSTSGAYQTIFQLAMEIA
jgi:hypothetical protein